MHNSAAETENLAERLEATGDYKILRRLKPRPVIAELDGNANHVGIMLDLETTGLDPTRDEVIEIGMVKFVYSDANEIIGVADTFQAFNEPSIAIPADVTALTGITNAMVAGHKIDGAAIEAFIADASIIIAHNAAFDRKFAERFWPQFEHKAWACSASQVDWRKHGFAGANLAYLLAGAGLFHDAHRAVDDCHALLEILSQPVKGAEAVFVELVANANRPTVRIWAQRSPFELKDILKSRGYRWCDGSDGRPKSWYTDVTQTERETELQFLYKEIYQRDVEILCRDITAIDRFSNRA